MNVRELIRFRPLGLVGTALLIMAACSTPPPPQPDTLDLQGLWLVEPGPGTFYGAGGTTTLEFGAARSGSAAFLNRADANHILTCERHVYAAISENVLLLDGAHYLAQVNGADEIELSNDFSELTLTRVSGAPPVDPCLEAEATEVEAFAFGVGSWTSLTSVGSRLYFNTDASDNPIVGYDTANGVLGPERINPGNHDHLGPMSIWSSPVLREELPEHVHILQTAGVVQVSEGVEIVAAPWTGKHPTTDPVAGAVRLLPEGPAPDGTVRIVVGHGGVDLLDRDQHNPAPVAVEPLVAALDAGRVHYVALGDRHSTTQVGDPAIWYSGAPEPTDWREQRPGEVLVVDVEPGPRGQRGSVQVRPHRVARWTYLALQARVDSDDDLAALDRRLTAVADKERTVVRLALRGTLGLAQHARLEEILERHGDLLGALHRPEQHNDVVLVGDDDLGELGLGGFLASALTEIQQEAAAPQEGRGGSADEDPQEEAPFRPGLPDDEASARDALFLLYRLTQGGSR